MKNAICAELYKLRHNRLLWFVPVLYAAMGFYSGLYEHEVMNTYRGLELFSLTELAGLFLPFAVTTVTGYVTGGDFSRRTVQNALSVGTDRKSYYFSRLLVQGLLTGALFLVIWLPHIVCHLILPRGNTQAVIALLASKLMVYMAVLLLQLLAYVSVMNAVCYFVKKPLSAIVAGIILVYLEMILRQVATQNGVGFIRELVRFSPANVIHGFFAYAYYDRVFTGEFLGYGISAVFLMIISSAAGYIRFEYGGD